uniref:Uncharacterized protein n=1 Tax=Oryza sativa subsp. japonica TaxID=39947 RepID=Q69LG0_ORYSJ|nr:hypothetical protein [Oryza sativa Japonica Group]
MAVQEEVDGLATATAAQRKRRWRRLCTPIGCRWRRAHVVAEGDLDGGEGEHGTAAAAAAQTVGGGAPMAHGNDGCSACVASRAPTEK